MSGSAVPPYCQLRGNTCIKPTLKCSVSVLCERQYGNVTCAPCKVRVRNNNVFNSQLNLTQSSHIEQTHHTLITFFTPLALSLPTPCRSLCCACSITHRSRSLPHSHPHLTSLTSSHPHSPPMQVSCAASHPALLRCTQAGSLMGRTPPTAPHGRGQVQVCTGNCLHGSLPGLKPTSLCCVEQPNVVVTWFHCRSCISCALPLLCCACCVVQGAAPTRQ